MSEQKNIILGGGLTGLSAAFHLKNDYVVYEKNPETNLRFINSWGITVGIDYIFGVSRISSSVSGTVDKASATATEISQTESSIQSGGEGLNNASDVTGYAQIIMGFAF